MIRPLTPEQSDVLIADLSEIGFYAFEEEEAMLNAFIEREDFNIDEFNELLPHKVLFESEIIIEENWNKQWEEHFRPVVIKDFAAVRANFHQQIPTVQYEIIITPKMSFGTGHHATTFMMIDLMSRLDFKGKAVIDFGTGTGVLAILADKLGADSIIAVDNDDWSIENAKENVIENRCDKVTVIKAGSLADLNKTDIILANINLNVLVLNAGVISDLTLSGGYLILSGILKTDVETIVGNFEKNGFRTVRKEGMLDWVALIFCKI